MLIGHLAEAEHIDKYIIKNLDQTFHQEILLSQN